MTERSPLLQAYDRVILRVKSMHFEGHGTEYGALSWLSSQLDITPQTLDNWGKRSGFPQAHVDRIHELTKLKKTDIRPDILNIQVSAKTWKEEATKKLATEAIIRSGTRGRKYA